MGVVYLALCLRVCPGCHPLSVCLWVSLSICSLHSRERESDNVEERVCQFIRDTEDLYLDVIMYKVGVHLVVA